MYDENLKFIKNSKSHVWQLKSESAGQTKTYPKDSARANDINKFNKILKQIDESINVNNKF